MRPWPVRLVRASIATLLWGAFSLPLASVFRWMGTELVMPPSYGPSWKGFVVIVGVTIFLAFFLERESLAEKETRAEREGLGGDT